MYDLQKSVNIQTEEFIGVSPRATKFIAAPLTDVRSGSCGGLDAMEAGDASAAGLRMIAGLEVRRMGFYQSRCP